MHAATAKRIRESAEADQAAEEAHARFLASAMVRAERFLIFNLASTRLALFWRFCGPFRTCNLVQTYLDQGPTIERVKSIRFVFNCSSVGKH